MPMEVTTAQKAFTDKATNSPKPKIIGRPDGQHVEGSLKRQDNKAFGLYRGNANKGIPRSCRSIFTPASLAG